MCQHIDKFKLLDNCHSGFRTGHSTETAILHIMDDALQALDQNQTCLLVLLDLSSAFDTVNHENLLARLHDRMGFTGDVLKWFESFLQNRTHRFLVDKSLSRPDPISIGVPQGSTLSPSLFNLYVEPLTEIFRGANISYHMYADDTQIYIKIGSQEDIKAMNEALKMTLHWLTVNHLKLNAQKTEFLVISPSKKSSIGVEWKNLITALNCTPTLVESTKLLGITLDKNLDMKAHIKAVARSARFHLNYIRKIKPLITPEDLKLAVQSLVISRLEYGCTTLAGLPKAATAPLKACLNAAARIVTGSRKYDHISPHLKALNWLPYEARIQLKMACITHKALHHKTPKYLAQKLELPGGNRPARKAREMLLKPPIFRKKQTYDRAFSGAAPKIWNSFPPNIRVIQNTASFKKEAKIFLMSKFLP